MKKCEHCNSYEVKVLLQMDSEDMNLCMNCYNKLMAEELEIDLKPYIDTFSLKDYRGISRTFHVERRIHSMGIYMEAVETHEFGYKFAIHGELHSNQKELLNLLIEKTRKGTGKKQIESKVFPSGKAFASINNDQLTGIIENDGSSDGTPLVIIDGQPYTWEEVGNMLMAYEGFQIKVQMYDITDDVE